MPAGRKKKPTKIHVLNGNPSGRPLPENEPKPEIKGPVCPEHLCDDAKKEWARIVPQLEKLGLVSEMDSVAIEGYCQSYALYKTCMEFIKKNGTCFPMKNPDGTLKYLQQFPQVAVANKALIQIRAFCTEFGLTPSARARMSVPGLKEDTDSTMEAMLRILES